MKRKKSNEILPEEIWNDSKSKKINDFIKDHKELERQRIIQDLVDQEAKDIQRFSDFVKNRLKK